MLETFTNTSYYSDEYAKIIFQVFLFLLIKSKNWHPCYFCTLMSVHTHTHMPNIRTHTNIKNTHIYTQ